MISIYKLKKIYKEKHLYINYKKNVVKINLPFLFTDEK